MDVAFISNKIKNISSDPKNKGIVKIVGEQKLEP